MASERRSVREPQIQVMRSQLGRVRGLGAAKSGLNLWWMERVTALALLPLSLWFMFSVLSLLHADRADMVHWASNPLNTALLFALIWATFHHMALGLQMVIEDYIHGEAAKSLSLLAMKALTIILALASVVAVLRLAYGH